ncbi:PaaX family transcriptional regulator [Actinoplanes lobatus]|uniref:PaaX family transcriptional regulator n=1 Tax=Actinoplanes lobatus TaxID=113568 RepID=A0A7W7MH43_9ACTN|nr:PaaX family transcriptional regulator C-terminal domain-containing protein [Actinoplanes lobatus]MBB4750107.1 phenylacetic acid degradation operon negative regulatory protein [Actinoplanes lobatus]GGN75216.1 PaaX family transcriptional regulator [Actinoplanes lobatus]GIE39004.1 PaaX family transcriptional regulator [Actinoplanes lobatus]
MPSNPQTLMLMLLGDFVLDRDVCVFSGSVIDVLDRLGISSHATRSTLTRMVNRGLLRRQRDGRKMYFGLTPRAAEILRDGRARIWETGAVNDRWDGTWTLLCFSLPESWQRQRHDLRSQLAWSGFGPLQGGLWIAPGVVPAQDIVDGLGLSAHARVFHARAADLTDIGQMVSDAYDLAGLAARYQEFLDRWEGPAPYSDPLAARLSLIAEWLGAIRRDPRLPVEHLPVGWPAVRAQKLFRDLDAASLSPARALAAGLLDLTPSAVRD